MIRLGGPLMGLQTQDPREIARAHKDYGFTAAYCPDPLTVEQSDPVREVREGFAAEDVVIAEVGAWCNMIAAEEERRATNQQYVRDRLALAEEVGARCCVDFVGSVAPGTDYGPDPRNLAREGFDLTVETVRKIIDAVQPKRTKFCLEMMQWVLPDNVQVYKELIEAVDRPAFAVHLDPVNIIVSPRMYFDTASVLKECFRVLGPWVVSCHAKDLTLHGDLALHFDEVPMGQGNMDYTAYLKGLDALPGEVPLMLEHLETQEQYAAARDHVMQVAREAGVTLKQPA